MATVTHEGGASELQGCIDRYFILRVGWVTATQVARDGGDWLPVFDKFLDLADKTPSAGTNSTEQPKSQP